MSESTQVTMASINTEDTAGMNGNGNGNGNGNLMKEETSAPMPEETNEAPTFPPATNDMLQVVDYEENFNRDLLKFLKENGLTDLIFSYHVTSILGAQSSGKSTLLNLLFGTEFQTMNESQGRYQVTQGIWLGLDHHEKNNIILDLEGTDSRERGGEMANNYERKIALFALVLSEILLINVWAQDIGRYNASNLDLLKTIMELNLQLFYTNVNHETLLKKNKTKLLFVIRDHVTSPLDKLKSILLDDVQNIWNGIQQSNVTSDCIKQLQLSDLFIIDFFSLPHKILMPDDFKVRGEELKRQFVEGDIFEHEYVNDIAADGFSDYANNVWTTIRDNKELDIPSQKEMLAHVRCEQIENESLQLFKRNVETLCQDENEIITQLIERLGRFVNEAIENYRGSAVRYTEKVANNKEEDLKEKILIQCNQVVNNQIVLIDEKITKEITKKMNNRQQTNQPWEGWYNEKMNIRKQLDIDFYESLIGIEDITEDNIPLYDLKIYVDNEKMKLNKQVDEIINRYDEQVKEESKNFIVKHYNDEIKDPIHKYIEKNDLDIWMKISQTVNNEWSNTLQHIRNIWSEKGIGIEGIENGEEIQIEHELGELCKTNTRALIKQTIGSSNSILMRMSKQFNDAFRFDDRGIPRHFGPGDDIEAIFVSATDSVMSKIDVLSKLKLNVDFGSQTNDTNDERDMNINENENGSSKEEEGVVVVVEEILLNENNIEELKEQLKTQASVIFMEARRSQEAARVTAKIPIWLMLMLLILGWNEFMTVLKNPVLLFLSVLIAPVIYLAYVVDAPTLLGPAVGATISPYIAQVKQVIDQVIQPAAPAHAPVLATVPAPAAAMNITRSDSGMGPSDSSSSMSSFSASASMAPPLTTSTSTNSTTTHTAMNGKLSNDETSGTIAGAC